MMRRPSPLLLAVTVLAGLALSGCAETTLAIHAAKQVNASDSRPQGEYKVGNPYQIAGTWYYPSEDYNFNETGIASFYGGERSGVNFHGRLTANGEVYDMNALTAAHQTLPMPSLVRVTNLENGRSLVLRVNDRGPFARGRIIDVSRRAAQLLGFEGQGTTRVQVRILAQESQALRASLLRGAGGGGETVAAVPRESVVASDALPPPPGARSAGPVASVPLPPPSATLPPASGAQQPSRRNANRNNNTVNREPVARPAPPVITQPGSALAVPVAPGAARTTPPVSNEVAALPVPQQAAAAPVITQEAVRASNIFVQAGAFTNYDNAYRLSARLSRYGRAQVTQVSVGNQQLYRVRVGPVQSVQEADALLADVTGVAPEARIVVD
ncbi:MAG: septal ring lytic transglycosylase RlpA family protein [Rhodospirillales bacterium]|nr:septal ring lytic transglycosylase RlpA family protein [Rhodospirillales bacterium]